MSLLLLLSRPAGTAASASGDMSLGGSVNAAAPATATGSLAFDGSAVHSTSGINGSITLSGTAAATAAPAAITGSLDLGGVAIQSTAATGAIVLSGGATPRAPTTASGSMDLVGAVGIAQGVASAAGSLTLSSSSAASAASGSVSGSLSFASTSDAQAPASSVAGALSLSGTTDNPNLLSGDSAYFEGGIGSWTGAGTAPFPTLTQELSDSWSGGASMRITWPTNSVLSFANLNVTGLTVGQQYRVTARIKVPTGQPNVILTAASNVTLNSNGTVTTKDSWVYATAIFTVTGTGTVQIRVRPQNLPSTDGDYALVDHILLTTTNVPASQVSGSPFFPVLGFLFLLGVQVPTLVKAVATAAGSVTLDGVASASGSGIATGSLTFGGSATQSSVASGSLDLGGSTDAPSGGASVAGALSLDGSAVQSSLATGSLDISGSVDAAAPASATGSVDLSGEANPAAPSSATGSLSFAGAADGAVQGSASGTLSLAGGATPTSSASVTGSIAFTQSASGVVSPSGSGSLSLSALATHSSAARGSINLSGTTDNPNLLTGDSAYFEGGIGAWTGAGTAPFPTLTQDLTDSWSGSASMRVTWPTNAVLAFANLNVSGLTVGQQYRVTARIKVPTGNPNITLTAANATLNTTQIVTAKDTWVYATVVFTVTSTSAVQIRVRPTNLPSTAGDYALVDHVLISPTSVPPSQVSGSPPVPVLGFLFLVGLQVPTLVKAVATAAGSITFDSSGSVSARGSGAGTLTFGGSAGHTEAAAGSMSLGGSTVPAAPAEGVAGSLSLNADSGASPSVAASGSMNLTATAVAETKIRPTAGSMTLTGSTTAVATLPPSGSITFGGSVAGATAGSAAGALTLDALARYSSAALGSLSLTASAESPNLITGDNADFDGGIGAWYAGGTAPLPTLSQETGDSYSGSGSLRIDWATNTLTTHANLNISGLTNGAKYRVLARVKVPTGSPNTFFTVTGGGALIGAAASITQKDTWVFIDVPFTVISGVSPVVIRLRNATPTTAGNYALLDHVIVTPGEASYVQASPSAIGSLTFDGDLDAGAQSPGSGSISLDGSVSASVTASASGSLSLDSEAEQGATPAIGLGALVLSASTSGVVAWTQAFGALDLSALAGAGEGVSAAGEISLSMAVDAVAATVYWLRWTGTAYENLELLGIWNGTGYDEVEVLGLWNGTGYDLLETSF